MPTLYSHRNGETEPPSVEGRFWFKGMLDKIPSTGIVAINAGWQTTCWPDWIEGWSPPDDFQGQWWGPVTPPWNESTN